MCSMAVIVGGGVIVDFQYFMRKLAYYCNLPKRNLWQRLLCWYHSIRYSRLSMKLGFTMGCNCFGYGLLIPHYGTIVINGEARVGNFAVLHTCTNIAGKKQIGDGFYLSTGSQIVGDITISDNVTVASNSLVNKSVESDKLVGGVPAKVLKDDYTPWYVRDGESFSKRVAMIEQLKKEMNIN